MLKRLFLFAAALALTLATCNAAHAQLAVEDPTLDGISIEELPLQQYDAQAHSLSLINQVKAYLLDTQQFITESDTYATTVQIYTTAQQTFKEAVQAYNLAYLAMSAPTILYDTMKTLPTTYKSAFTPQADTYGLAAMMVQTVNLGSANALQSYSNMSMAPVSVIPTNYNQLSAPTQKQLQAQASTMSANDSLIATSLQRATDVQKHTLADQVTLQQLETNTFTTDPAQKTELATLQRINTALVLLVRAQEDSNQMAAANQLQHLMDTKQDLDAQKANVYAAQDWQSGMTQLQSETQGAAAIMTYAPPPTN
jgi:hypothetical protein